MNIDTPTASVIVAAIAAIASIATAYMTRQQGQKVTETHKQVTVNHHSSETPTVLDRIDDVKQLVLGQGKALNDLQADFNGHIAHSNQMEVRLMAVESEVHRP